MTINEIKAQFKPGSKWHAIRESDHDVIIHGNAGPVVLTAKHTETDRIVEKCGSKDIVFLMESGKRYWTPIPKASHILEARPGFIRFIIPEVCTVSLTATA